MGVVEILFIFLNLCVQPQPVSRNSLRFVSAFLVTSDRGKQMGEMLTVIYNFVRIYAKYRESFSLPENCTFLDSLMSAISYSVLDIE